MNTDSYLDPFIETLGREALEQVQFKKLQIMLGDILEGNRFYRRKLAEVGISSPQDLQSLEDLTRLPFTDKAEFSKDQRENPPYGTNLTYPIHQYTRIHQTAGTSSEPLLWLDTEESWRWWTRCWATTYAAAGVTAIDRIFLAFSFGPYIGFWSAFEGGDRYGSLCVPGGGMSSYQRARAIIAYDISVLISTPSYALYLAEVAEQEGIDLTKSSVNITIHAGEPGASLPAYRRSIESAWQARCYDHAGSTGVGAWGFTCQRQAGLHINEGEFIYEIIDPDSGEAADEGELVMTNLGRTGMPILRFRTGDRVKLEARPCECGRTYARLDGGVIGRIDQVLNVRGINVFPSALEDIVRRSSAVNEFAVDVYRQDKLDEMRIRIEVKGEDPLEVSVALAKQIRHALGFRVQVEAVPIGTLPRFDRETRRITDHRESRNTSTGRGDSGQ
jgi:phenylacetate-CoA ligase